MDTAQPATLPTLPHLPRDGAPWSADDRQRLQSGLTERRPVAAIAAELGRTPKAIRVMADKLRLKARVGSSATAPGVIPAATEPAPLALAIPADTIDRRRRWTPSMDTQLTEWWTAGLTAVAIAERLGCSAGAVRCRAVRLALPQHRRGHPKRAGAGPVAPEPDRQRRDWDAADVSYLTAFAAEYSLVDLARGLGRPPSAILAKIHKLGLAQIADWQSRPPAPIEEITRDLGGALRRITALEQEARQTTGDLTRLTGELDQARAAAAHRSPLPAPDPADADQVRAQRTLIRQLCLILARETRRLDPDAALAMLGMTQAAYDQALAYAVAGGRNAASAPTSRLTAD